MPESSQAARRVYITVGELPGLLSGGVRSDPVKLRRILGARRTGRWGLAGVTGAALLAVPPASAATLLALHVVLSAAGFLSRARAAGLTVRAHQRVLVFMIAPALSISAILRGLIWVFASELEGAVPMLVAGGLLAAHGRLWIRLGRREPFGPEATLRVQEPDALR